MQAIERGVLVLQSTPFCNIDCKYCYLPDRSNKKQMTLSLVERVIDEVVNSGVFRDGFAINWHAGEPLVLPATFYRDCLTITDRYQTEKFEIRHIFQTNGTLIDETWCDFFKQPNVYVGVSVDGPAALHDVNRVDRRGRGTFAQVERGLSMLRSHRITFGVLSVITYNHLDHAEEMFEFLCSTGAHDAIFNFEEVEGPHKYSSFSKPDAIIKFKEFIRKIFALNRQRGSPLTFLNLNFDLLGVNGTLQNNQTTPWAIITVDCDGNVCTFSPELMGTKDPYYSNFVLGNLLKDPIERIAAGIPYQRLATEINQGLERCRRECDYFGWCGGGAPSNKYFENGSFDSTETIYCRFMRKALCDVNFELLEQKVQAKCGQDHVDATPLDL